MYISGDGEEGHLSGRFDVEKGDVLIVASREYRSRTARRSFMSCLTGRRDGDLPPKPSYLDAPPEISPFPRFSLIELVFEFMVGFSRDAYS